MKFELGKYYQHSTGKKLYICGLGETFYHGSCFIGENEKGELSPTGKSEENAINYIEITKEEFENREFYHSKLYKGENENE